jgi:ankyrin repeat protein
MPNQLVDAIRAKKLAGVRAAAKADAKSAVHPSAMVEAARAAFLPALEILAKAAPDNVNALWKNYRPLHAVMQPKTHGAAEATHGRGECLEWLLDHGADPELAGGWPSARAILIAAFVGGERYVRVLKDRGAKVDGFVQAALGTGTKFPTDRDPHGLAALHCAAASRMDPAATTAVARRLLDAGADLHATCRSWDHDLDALYLAASSHNRALFELLLERGADATQGLVHALWGPGVEFAEIALAHGAAPDRAVADDKPLLNHLIAWGQVKSALWLLEHGANPHIADARGWTAVDQARSRGNARLIQAVERV